MLSSLLTFLHPPVLQPKQRCPVLSSPLAPQPTSPLLRTFVAAPWTHPLIHHRFREGSLKASACSQGASEPSTVPVVAGSTLSYWTAKAPPVTPLDYFSCKPHYFGKSFILHLNISSLGTKLVLVLSLHMTSPQHLMMCLKFMLNQSFLNKSHFNFFCLSHLHSFHSQSILFPFAPEF